MKKKMSSKKFNIIVSAVLVILVVFSILLTTLTNYYKQAVNQLLGAGEITTSDAEGSEDWNADYYNVNDITLEDVEVQAKEVSQKIGEEGTVLLKNENGSLPLSNSASEIAVFGWSFYHPVYGGAGAGSVDESAAITPKQSLIDAGYTINETVEAAYENYSEESGYTERPGAVVGEGSSCSWVIPEMTVTTEAQDAAATSDTAIVWIARQGAEGYDLPTCMDADNAGLSESDPGYNPEKHYLELSDDEEAMIAAVEASFDNVIVCINSSNVMELGELQNDSNIDSILWVGGGGECGFEAIGEILSGEVNPSGHLSDIYPSDILADPASVNVSDPEYNTNHASTNKYTNVTLDNADTYAFFVQYEEGIYIGYKYYETAYAEAEAGNYDGFDYDSAVVYPFGYGLSYTEFTQEITDFSEDDGMITVEVTVTNTGDTAGKDVVELYYTPPYTAGGIEKSDVNLIAFDKTEELKAGESETVTLTFAVEDMASYDDENEKAYVLDAGEYVISVRSDSHTVLDSETYTVEDSKIYNEENDGKRDSDAVAATNAFDDNMVGVSEDFNVMSRSDFAGTFPQTATDTDRTASDELIEYLQTYTADEDIEASEVTEMPATGEESIIQLINLRGLDYDDELWDEFLDQFTVEEMTELVGSGGFGTLANEENGVPQAMSNDGPASLKTSGIGTDATSSYMTGFPTEVTISATWNKDLVNEMGQVIGLEGTLSGVSGWYAPGLNTHRTAFGGRNFEYYSEDAVLAGTLAAEEISGAAQNGLIAYVKHFAMNEQESYRNSQSVGGLEITGMDYTTFTPGEDVVLLTWADEQTIRETYLKPFEIAVKNATYEETYISDEDGTLTTVTKNATQGIMTSFNYIGNEWAGGDSGLLTTVLKNEWGFAGSIITDANFFSYMNVDQLVMAGGTLSLSTMAPEVSSYASEAAYVSQLREALHGNLYMLANSGAMENIKPGTVFTYSLPTWQKAVYAVDIIVAILVVLGIVMMVRRTKKMRTEA